MPELCPLSDNVYGVTGLFHPSGKGVNAGFIITDKSIVHIDAGGTVADGKFLLEQSREKAGSKPKLVLTLTHHHWDHIFGMRAFKEAGAKIVAHKKADGFLSFRTPPLFRSVRSTYIPFVEKLLAKRYSYTREKAKDMLKDVKLFSPDEIFNEDTEARIDETELSLIYTPGHVPDEISVYHLESRTLFSGDTIYEGMPLTTRYGGPKQWQLWIESLKKLAEMPIEKIVPGHGKICEKGEIQRNIAYLEDLLSKKPTQR